MYDVPFLLNHAIDRHHRRGENNAAPTLEQRRSNHLGQTTALTLPVSSSRVRNLTPLAEPNR
jgi:hypothetical protein